VSGTIDASGALLRAIADRFPGLEFAVEEIRSRSWASVTFTGARHELTVRVDGTGAGTAADTFLAGLEAAEFALRGHILADIALITDARHDGGGSVLLQLQALTVKDD
jgi:hypothetical protein